MCNVSACVEELMPDKVRLSECLLTRDNLNGRDFAKHLSDVLGLYVGIERCLKTRHYGRVVKATDSNFVRHLFPYGSAGSNPAGVVFFPLFFNVRFPLRKALSRATFSI